MTRTIGTWILLALALGALGVAACGGDDDSTCTDCDADVGDETTGDVPEEDAAADADGDGDGDGDEVEAEGDGEVGDVPGDDGGTPCTEAADCDDGLFCNGLETCPDGFCAAGTPPELDDGVACTLDSCDEDADAVLHVPDDTACADLGTDPACDAGGRIVRDLGVCDPEHGCVATSTTVESCADPAPDPACAGSAATDDLTFLSDGFCDDSGEAAVCAQVETPCTADPALCADGMLTTNTPTCDPDTGCGATSETTPCPTTPDHCEEMTHVAYTAACADGTRCGPGEETRTACPTPPPTCEEQVRMTWGPRCDDDTGCGAVPVEAMDCDALDSQICTGDSTYQRVNCSCSVAEGCTCVTSTGRCDRLMAPMCVDANTLRSSWEYCDTATGGCAWRDVDTVCPAGCCTRPWPAIGGYCCT